MTFKNDIQETKFTWLFPKVILGLFITVAFPFIHTCWVLSTVYLFYFIFVRVSQTSSTNTQMHTIALVVAVGRCTHSNLFVTWIMILHTTFLNVDLFIKWLSFSYLPIQKPLYFGKGEFQALRETCDCCYNLHCLLINFIRCNRLLYVPLSFIFPRIACEKWSQKGVYFLFSKWCLLGGAPV